MSVRFSPKSKTSTLELGSQQPESPNHYSHISESRHSANDQHPYDVPVHVNKTTSFKMPPTERDHVTGRDDDDDDDDRMEKKDHATRNESQRGGEKPRVPMMRPPVETPPRKDGFKYEMEKIPRSSSESVCCPGRRRFLFLFLFVVVLAIVLTSSVYYLATRGEDLSFQSNMMNKVSNINERMDLKFDHLREEIFDSLNLPRDCNDILAKNQMASGVYRVYPGNKEAVSVFCDMTTPGGPWLVFQRRQDNTTNFYRDWKSYADGFGDLKGNFWLGNENVHMLTSMGRYKLRIDLEDFEGLTAYAEYSSILLSSGDDFYRLNVSGYTGNAGDSLEWYHSGHRFTTMDSDNDGQEVENCAVTYRGAWWYNHCIESDFHGLYLYGNITAYKKGVHWIAWRGAYYSLKKTEMKISRNV